MKFVAFYFMSLSLFASSCVHRNLDNQPRHERSELHLCVCQTIAKLVRKKYKLKMSSEGCISQLDVNKTRGESYGFFSVGCLDVGTARELVVKITLEVLKVLNEDNEYRKYLYEHPFNIKNIDISIFSEPVSRANRNERTYPKIRNVSLSRKHLRFKYYTKDHDLVNLNDLEYLKFYKSFEETFRFAIHKVQHTLSPELLEVANQLDLLNGNLEDDYIDCSAESDIEDNKIENKISRYKAMYKDGNITEERMKQFIEEAVSEIKDISREEKIEKFRELHRTNVISEKRMQKLIELEENTEPYIQDD